jgi:hypothetical protein
MEVDVHVTQGGGVLKRGVVLGHELAGVEYVLGSILHTAKPNRNNFNPNTTPLAPLAHLVAHLLNGAGLRSE